MYGGTVDSGHQVSYGNVYVHIRICVVCESVAMRMYTLKSCINLMHMHI